MRFFCRIARGLLKETSVYLEMLRRKIEFVIFIPDRLKGTEMKSRKALFSLLKVYPGNMRCRDSGGSSNRHRNFPLAQIRHIGIYRMGFSCARFSSQKNICAGFQNFKSQFLGHVLHFTIRLMKLTTSRTPPNNIPTFCRMLEC